MRRRSAVFGFAAAVILPLALVPAAAHEFGQVTLDPGLEVTQSVQTLPQAPGEEFGIGLTAHKPTAIRAYIRATRYTHFLFFHFPSFAAVSVNGTLTIRRVSDNAVIATLPASNGPIAVTPWVTPNPANANSSLTFKWSFPPSDLVRFELDLTTTTPGVTAIDPPSTTRDFVHNHRVRIQAVKLQYDHDDNPATPPTKSPEPDRVADGYRWFLKTGPLAPCKLQYWVNPTPLQWGNDLTAASDGGLLGTLAGMDVQGSTTYDNVYGWWQGAVSGNGLAQTPACGGANSKGAYGNTELSRYQRTFTHEVYHNYCQVHQSAATGQIGVVGFDTDVCAPVPANKLDVMVAGQLTAAAWQSPSRYDFFWTMWADFGPEPFFDACHFNWWQLVPPEVFLPFGPLNPFEEELQPVDVIFVNGIINPERTGILWPSWRVMRPVPARVIPQKGEFAVELIGLQGEVVLEQRFDASHDGDGDKPAPHSFSFSLPAPVDPVSKMLNLSEIRLLDGTSVLDRILVTAELPAVQITQPLVDPGQQPPVLDKPFELRWQTTDSDSPEVYSAVQYSPDDGQHYLGLANNMMRTSLMVDPADLPGGSKVRLRVMVSDGLNTAEASVGPFMVPRKAPMVLITGPESPTRDTPFVAGADKPVTLEGYGSSPDDGVLPADQLEWTSDLQGPLGTGYVLEARLREGQHRITLSGTDRAGVRASAIVDILVLPFRDTDGDGTPDYADACPLLPGPPENDGCPYPPIARPLVVGVQVVDPAGDPRQSYGSFFDVFFEIELENPRPAEVSVQAFRVHLTHPDGLLQTVDRAASHLLPPGGKGTQRFSFFDVFTGGTPKVGAYSVVFEPLAGPLAPLGRQGNVFQVDPNLREICNGPAAGEPGTRVDVPIVVSNGDGVAGFQVDVSFNPAVLTPAAVRLGADTAAAGGWSLSSAPVGPGALRVLGHSSPPAGLGPTFKELAVIEFDIAAGAPMGPTPLSESNCVLSDASGRGIPCDRCPRPGAVIVRHASSYLFQPMPSPVGVDPFDPLAFDVSVQALDSLGNPAVNYNATAAMTVGPICGGTLQPATLMFVAGLGGPDTFEIACCLDPLLPSTAASLTMMAADAPIQVSGTSAPFLGVAKGDVDASGGVNVLDVTRAVRQALLQSVPTPPPTGFQFWAANLLDQTCAPDGTINVLDVVRVRNKALGRPPLCPCPAAAGAQEGAAQTAAPARPISIALVREGPRSHLVVVQGAEDLGGLQIELRGAGPKARVELAELTDGRSWQATTERVDGKGLRVVAFSNTATGVSGDGALLRITEAGHPKLVGVVASDSQGREIPVR